MKVPFKYLPFLAGAAIFAASSLQAVETDPVGYVTLTVNGTGGVGSEAFSFLSAPLVAASSSSAQIDSVAANSIVGVDVSWTADEFNDLYYVEITAGTNVGVSATITDTTATTLTTFEDLSALISAGDAFVIRKYITIADIFGANNEAGLQGGSSAASADTILIPDSTTQGFVTYYYKNSGLGSPGWFSTSSSGEKSAIPFYPGSGFIVKRIESSEVKIVVSGAVQPNDASTPIEEDINFIASHFPTDVTLNQMFGSDGGSLIGGSSAASADTVLIPNGSGGFTTYYYKNSGLGSPGWFSTSVSGEQGDTVIAGAGDIVIVNRSKGTAFNLAESITY